MKRLSVKLGMAGLLCAMAWNAAAQAPMIAIEGEYTLASSSTAPQNGWGYTKGHVTIKKLDERHVLILQACEWKRVPKAVCADHYFAQWRDGSLVLQDMNTFAIKMYFEPTQRTLTMISRGFDAKASVRRDVYTPATAPLTDPALVRRMQRETANAGSKENLRVFGHYSKWVYAENRIELQTAPAP